MAHVGQEVTLGTIGAVGALLGLKQLPFHQLAPTHLPAQALVPVEDRGQEQQSHRQDLPQQAVVGGGDDLPQQPLVVNRGTLLRGDGGNGAVDQRKQRGVLLGDHHLERELHVGDARELDLARRESLDLLVQHRQDVDRRDGPASGDRFQGRARVGHQHEVDPRGMGLQQVVGAVIPAHRDAPPRQRVGAGKEPCAGRAGDGDGVAFIGVGEQRVALAVGGTRGCRIEVRLAPLHGRQYGAEGPPFARGLGEAELATDQLPVVFSDAGGRAVAVGEVEGHPGRGQCTPNDATCEVGPFLGAQIDLADGGRRDEPALPNALLVRLGQRGERLVQDRREQGQVAADRPVVAREAAPAVEDGDGLRLDAGQQVAAQQGLSGFGLVDGDIRPSVRHHAKHGLHVLCDQDARLRQQLGIGGVPGIAAVRRQCLAGQGLHTRDILGFLRSEDAECERGGAPGQEQRSLSFRRGAHGHGGIERALPDALQHLIEGLEPKLGAQAGPGGHHLQELDEVTVRLPALLPNVGGEGIGADPDDRIGREPGTFFVTEIQRRLHAAVGHRGQPVLADGDVLLRRDGLQSLIDQGHQGCPFLARRHCLSVAAEGGGAGHLQVDDAVGLHQVIGDDQVPDIGVGLAGRQCQQRVPGTVLNGQDDLGLGARQQAVHDITALDRHCPAAQIAEALDAPRVLTGEDRPRGREVILAHRQCRQTRLRAFRGRQQVVLAVRTGHVLEPVDPGFSGWDELEIDTEPLADDPQVVDRHPLRLGPVDFPGRVLPDTDSDGVLLLQPGALVRADGDVRPHAALAPLFQNRLELRGSDGCDGLVDDARQRRVLLDDRIAQFDPAAGHGKRHANVSQHVFIGDPQQVGAGDDRVQVAVLQADGQLQRRVDLNRPDVGPIAQQLQLRQVSLEHADGALGEVLQAKDMAVLPREDVLVRAVGAGAEQKPVRPLRVARGHREAVQLPPLRPCDHVAPVPEHQLDVGAG